jgi:hypothetical protein
MANWFRDRRQHPWAEEEAGAIRRRIGLATISPRNGLPDAPIAASHIRPEEGADKRRSDARSKRTGAARLIETDPQLGGENINQRSRHGSRSFGATAASKYVGLLALWPLAIPLYLVLVVAKAWTKAGR